MYSEITHELYDTVEVLQKAEAEVQKEKEAQKTAEEKLVARLDEYLGIVEDFDKLLTQRLEKLEKTEKELFNDVKAFSKKYGYIPDNFKEKMNNFEDSMWDDDVGEDDDEPCALDAEGLFRELLHDAFRLLC